MPAEKREHMGLNHSKSLGAFERACTSLVGGVNSPVRSYQAVGGTPIVAASADGARLTDLDGNTYIDYVCAYGPLIHGHAQQQVVTAITKAARKGTSFGMPTPAETRLAEEVLAAFPHAGKVRFVNSGAEACMSVIRLARGATGRDKIIKVIGCYHGHVDAMLVEAGSGATTLGQPSSAGVPASAVADTLLVPYNDVEAVRKTFEDHPGQVAAMVLEPVCGNMGVVTPRKGYLAALRELCDMHGALLVFDEVMTGFRLAFGGAQEKYDVPADLTAIGKIVGGGLPVGAFLGRAELMDLLAPSGPVYQAGTLSGNPLAMEAGLAALEPLRDGAAYGRLEGLGGSLVTQLKEAAASAGMMDRITINRAGSMITVFFHPGPVQDYAAAVASDTKAFAAFFHAMLEAGVSIPPSQFEAWFVSTAHSEDDLAATGEAAVEAFAEAKKVMN